MKVLVIGPITRDIVIAPAGSFVAVGGTAYYSSLAIRRLGGEVAVLTKLNLDRDRELLKKLEHNGIKVVAYNSSTEIFENKYLSNGRRVQRVMSTIEPFSLDEILETIDKLKPDLVYFGPLLKDEMPVEHYSEIRKQFDGNLVLDIQGHLRALSSNQVIPYKPTKLDFLKNFDTVKLSKEEFDTLFDNQEMGLKELSNLVSEIVLTLGKNGSLIYANSKKYNIPPLKIRKEVDSTGCGDVYFATYVYARLLGYPIEGAGLLATTLAGLKAEHKDFDFEYYIRLE